MNNKYILYKNALGKIIAPIRPNQTQGEYFASDASHLAQVVEFAAWSIVSKYGEGTDDHEAVSSIVRSTTAPDFLARAMERMSEDRLTHLSTVFSGSGGSSYKAGLIQDVVFLEQTEFVSQLQTTCKMLQKLMRDATWLLLCGNFGARPAQKRIDWHAPQSAVVQASRAVTASSSSAAASSSALGPRCAGSAP